MARAIWTDEKSFFFFFSCPIPFPLTCYENRKFQIQFTCLWITLKFNLWLFGFSPSIDEGFHLFIFPINRKTRSKFRKTIFIYTNNNNKMIIVVGKVVKDLCWFVWMNASCWVNSVEITRRISVVFTPKLFPVKPKNC